jgi:glyoxylase-like metal-dependent hydrolase (beta-lactamase superfamily II)
MSQLSWTIGEVTIHQLIEVEDEKLFSTFIPQATPENIKKIPWLFPHFANESGNLKAFIQSFLIISQGKKILIYTCNGNDKDRPNVPSWSHLQTDFLSKLKKLGIEPTDIDIVACTHLHFDHVGWNTTLKNGQWVPTFPNAQYLFSKAEYDYWIAKPENEIIDDHNGIADSITPIVEAGLATFIEDDFAIDTHIRFIPTPGHTPHHISVVIESQGERAIISGDVLHHPCQIVHQEWTTLSDTYPDQTVATRQKFLSGITDTNTLLIGSHFAHPTAGKVVTKGSGLILEI